MDRFVRHALSVPPLDARAEHDLAVRARRGDHDARERLVVAGLRPIALHALMMGARDERLRDAVQAGAVAVLQALQRFDPDRGVRFHTYAWTWIHGAITAELGARRDVVPVAEQPGTAGLEPAAGDWLEGLDERARAVLTLRLGLAPGTSGLPRRQVAEHLGLTVSRVRRIEAEAMRQLRNRLDSIDSRAPEGSASVPYSSIGRAADC